MNKTIKKYCGDVARLSELNMILLRQQTFQEVLNKAYSFKDPVEMRNYLNSEINECLTAFNKMMKGEDNE